MDETKKSHLNSCEENGCKPGDWKEMVSAKAAVLWVKECMVCGKVFSTKIKSDSEEK